MFDAAHIAGLIAGGAHPNPVPHRRRRHPHHAQDAPRAARRRHPHHGRAGAAASTRPSSPGSRAARSSTSSPPRRWPSARPCTRRSAPTPPRSWPTPRRWPRPSSGQGFRLVSGGTDNHLMLVDLRAFDAELTGKEAQAVLDQAGITLNKNTIPDDPRSPFVTSGVRIGTPSVTTQGMKEPEMVAIAELIARALRDRGNPAELAAVREDVAVLCAKFTPYAGLRTAPACPTSPATRSSASSRPSSRWSPRRVVRRVALHFGWVVPPGRSPRARAADAGHRRCRDVPRARRGDGRGLADGPVLDPVPEQLGAARRAAGRGGDLRRRPDRRPPADLGAGEGHGHRHRRRDPRLVRRDDVLLPGAVLRRLLRRRRLGAARDGDLAPADGQRRQPHRRPRRPGRGHRRHRLGHVLPLQPAAQRRRPARSAEHRPPAGHHHPRHVRGLPAPQLQPRPDLHGRRWGPAPRAA